MSDPDKPVEDRDQPGNREIRPTLTMSEVLEILQVCENTWRAIWKKDPALAPKYVGRQPRWRVEVIEEYLRSR